MVRKRRYDPSPVRTDFAMHRIGGKVEPAGPRDGVVLDMGLGEPCGIPKLSEDAGGWSGYEGGNVDLALGPIHETYLQAMVGNYAYVRDQPRDSTQVQGRYLLRRLSVRT